MYRSVLASLLLVACAGAPPTLRTLAASGDGVATGTVLEDGTPAANVSLSLVGQGAGRHVTTDSSGRWTAQGLPAGDYTFYYLGRRPDEVAYWKGPRRHLGVGGHLAFSAIDVGHRGVPKEPAEGARIDLPGQFTWTAYPGATRYGFEVTSGTDQHSTVMFRPVHLFAPKVKSIVYDGGVNTRNVPHSDGLDYQGKPDHFLLPGTYTWSVVWSTKDAGTGQGPGHAFTVVALKPRMFPALMAPPTATSP